MTLSELRPDVALKTLLDGEIEVITSESEYVVLKCYEQAKMPNKGLADEFITVQNNGTIRSITKPIGVFRGNLAVSVWCRTNNDNTAKLNRIRQIVAQCERIVNGKVKDGFYFALDASNVITPATVNLSTGYAIEVLNVAWRTI